MLKRNRQVRASHKCHAGSEGCLWVGMEGMFPAMSRAVHRLLLLFHAMSGTRNHVSNVRVHVCQVGVVEAHAFLPMGKSK